MPRLVDILNKEDASNIEEVLKPGGLYNLNPNLVEPARSTDSSKPGFVQLDVTKSMVDRVSQNIADIPKTIEGEVSKLGKDLSNAVMENVQDTLGNLSELTNLPNRIVKETTKKVFDLGNDYIKKSFNISNKSISAINSHTYTAVTKNINKLLGHLTPKSFDKIVNLGNDYIKKSFNVSNKSISAINSHTDTAVTKNINKLLGHQTPKSFDKIVNLVSNNKSATSEFDVAKNQSSIDTTSEEKEPKIALSEDVGSTSKYVTFNKDYSNIHEKLPFRGYSEIANLEARVDNYYDIAITAPNHLKSRGLPEALSNNSKLSPLSNQADITSVSTSKFASSEQFQLGKLSELLTNRVDFIASITTDIIEDIDLSVRTWLIKYQNYRFQKSESGYNLPSPNVMLPPYLGYYYLTFYYLSYDKTQILFERTFYGVPTFDFDLSPKVSIRRYPIVWDIIGEEPSILAKERNIYLGLT